MRDRQNPLADPNDDTLITNSQIKLNPLLNEDILKIINDTQQEYDNVTMQLGKTMLNRDEKPLSHNSSLSFNSAFVTTSENSILSSNKEEEEEEDDVKNNDDDEENYNNYVTNDDCTKLQEEKVDETRIVVTPRSVIEIGKPIQQINKMKSFESVKTNKRPRKHVKSKKKQRSFNVANNKDDETSKLSVNNSAKKKKKKVFQGRLKNSNSKSTIMTKDTSDKKTINNNRKMKRQKSYNTLLYI